LKSPLRRASASLCQFLCAPSSYDTPSPMTTRSIRLAVGPVTSIGTMARKVVS
jgi:hypothetical protein